MFVMSSPKYIDRCYYVDLESKKKMHYFIVVSTQPEAQNGVFRTFLDFEKTKALQDL